MQDDCEAAVKLAEAMIEAGKTIAASRGWTLTMVAEVKAKGHNWSVAFRLPSGGGLTVGFQVDDEDDSADPGELVDMMNHSLDAKDADA